jgi:ABC-type nitrate/sulfonate/bicarbonate transport system substrate-binding protein
MKFGVARAGPWLAMFVGLALAASVPRAQALDAVQVGKAADSSFTFMVVEVGTEAGIFAQHGIAATVTAFAGDAKLQQAMAAGSIDFGLGSGPAMAFSVKGVPVIAVAAFAGEPRSISIVVAPDGPIKTVADLKGRLVAISTVGSLSEWLTKRLAAQQGWPPGSVRTVAVGNGAAMTAALKSGQVDAFMGSTEGGLQLEERHDGRILVGMNQFVPDFISHVIFARDDIVRDRPDLVQRFVDGFFASIAFIKGKKAETTAITGRLLRENPDLMSRIYDDESPMLRDNGGFDPEALAVLKDSFVDLGILPERPRDAQILTTRFLHG